MSEPTRQELLEFALQKIYVDAKYAWQQLHDHGDHSRAADALERIIDACTFEGIETNPGVQA